MTAGPAPGWYPDSFGATRWWDGHAWGGLQAPEPPSESRVLGTLVHLGVFAAFFVGPLVIRLVKKDDAWVRHHATEALNFQITFGLAWNGVWWRYPINIWFVRGARSKREIATAA